MIRITELIYNSSMSERLYIFRIDGKVELLSIQQARELKDPFVDLRINEIIYNSRNKRMVKDGFEPGWQENIREYASSRSEYDKMLRERGLVEVGYDLTPQDSTTVGGACNSEEFALHAKELGVELSDREIDAIKSGEYFDASKCDPTMDADYEKDLI